MNAWWGEWRLRNQKRGLFFFIKITNAAQRVVGPAVRAAKRINATAAAHFGTPTRKLQGNPFSSGRTS